MRRTGTTMVVLALGILLSLTAWAQDIPGKVLREVPLDLKTPTGLVWDGANLWVADLDTAAIYRVDSETGRLGKKIDAPAYSPEGLAWDGKAIWSLDAAEKTAFAQDPITGRTLRALALDMDTPEGLCWDGKALWVSDARSGVISRLDDQDGTTFSSWPCPTAGGSVRTQELGLTFDGKYLWISDRLTDTLYRMDPATGTVLDFFDSPGPYPAGLAWDGRHLWCVDYEKRKLYEMVASSSAPYVTMDPKHEKVVYTEAWRNFGPGTVDTLDVYIAIPRDLPNQKLLSPVTFEPEPDDIVTDRWGQQCAHFAFRKVKAGEDVSAVMTADVEVRRVRWFVDPDTVGKLEEIPKEIKEQYTQDSSKLVMSDPVIQKAVKESLGGERNPYWMARKINRYIQDKMHYELLGGWNVAPTVLSRGSGSCSEYTFVMLAMCHAAGLPARYAGSVVIRGDDASRDNVFHRWVEVYLPNYGWMPVDPSGGDSPVPADQTKYFGGLGNRFLITTLGAGDSKTLGWDYNSAATWTATGKVKLMQRKAGDWSPVGKKYEPPMSVEPGGLTCKPGS